MNDAYNIGVQLALQEAGLVKSAVDVSAWKGVTRLVRSAWDPIRDYATFANLRKALRDYSVASPIHPEIPSIDAALINKLMKSIKGAGRLKHMVSELTTQPAKVTARKEVMRQLRPYTIPLGLAAAGTGGYLGLKKLFPKSFGD